MSRRTADVAQLRNLHHPLHKGQRSFADTLVRVTYRDGRAPVVQYASPGRAAMMLVRYSPERYEADPTLDVMVTEVRT